MVLWKARHPRLICSHLLRFEIMGKWQLGSIFWQFRIPALWSLVCKMGRITQSLPVWLNVWQRLAKRLSVGPGKRTEECYSTVISPWLSQTQPTYPRLFQTQPISSTTSASPRGCCLTICTSDGDSSTSRKPFVIFIFTCTFRTLFKMA